MANALLHDYLDHFVHLGVATAYICRRGYSISRWSYGDVAHLAYRFARELDARHIHRGDRILLWGDNCPQWVAAFFGCVLQGVLVVPMDRIAAPGFAAKVAHQVGAKLIVCSGGLAQDGPNLPTLLLDDLRHLLAPHSSSLIANTEVKPSDGVEIVFTSGTTADPKGVVLSHNNILSNLVPLEVEIDKYLKYERLVHPIRFLNLLPLSHVFGQFLGIFVPQLMGAVVMFHETLKPDEIIHTIKHHRISVLVSVPRILEALKVNLQRGMEATGVWDRFESQLEDAEGEHFIKRWWRFRRIHALFGLKFWAFVSGGAALDRQTETFWQRLGFAVVQGYGLTETTSLISVNHPFSLGKGSIGKVLPGRELKLNEDGEILVRGENVASGYWHAGRIQPIESPEGWFHTGDIGGLDDEGYLYFRGRKKSVIVTAEGMNVFPEDLEAALRRQPEVIDCMVLGLPRNGNTEPCAVLILREAGADPAKIVQRANSSLAGYQHMRRWFVWPDKDFPRTSTHKPRLQEIDRFVQAQLREGASTVTPGERTLSELIERVTGRAAPNLSLETRLTSDLNLSSIERVELLGALEDRYQTNLSESSITEETTVAELERLVREPASLGTDVRYPRWTQRRAIRWIRAVTYYLVVWPATHLLAHPRVVGKAGLRSVRAPVIIIANHITSIDVGFILAALPMRLRHTLAVAMEGERLSAMRRPPGTMPLLKRWFHQAGYFLAVLLFSVFPLPQRSGFRQSFVFAGETVDRGNSLLVFPEGQRTQDGKLARFRSGIGLLANDLKLPIIPIRIDGLFELKQAGKRIARPGAIRVTVGAPVFYQAGTDPSEIARDLQDRVASLGHQNEE